MAEKKVKKENPKFKIEVEVEITDGMYLKQHYGNGSLGKTKFDASFTLPAMGLLVSVGEKTYLVPQQQIITSIIEHHEKAAK